MAHDHFCFFKEEKISKKEDLIFSFVLSTILLGIIYFFWFLVNLYFKYDMFKILYEIYTLLIFVIFVFLDKETQKKSIEIIKNLFYIIFLIFVIAIPIRDVAIHGNFVKTIVYLVVFFLFYLSQKMR